MNVIYRIIFPINEYLLKKKLTGMFYCYANEYFCCSNNFSTYWTTVLLFFVLQNKILLNFYHDKNLSFLIISLNDFSSCIMYFLFHTMENFFDQIWKSGWFSTLFELFFVFSFIMLLVLLCIFFIKISFILYFC